MKTCCTCKLPYPLEDYHNDRTNKDGKSNQCKNCKKEYKRLWNERNPEKRRKNKQLHKKLKKYNITKEEYLKMVDYQQNKCVICQQSCQQNPSLSIDHNHATGKVRGLLCNACNSGLGFFKDDINLIERAIKYLEAHP